MFPRKLALLFLLAVTGTVRGAEDEAASCGDGECANVKIVQGKTSQGGVSYYHCHGEESSDQLVLLHGARFTKEEWKTSGILDRFCSTHSMSVTALDVNVEADHEKLLSTLKDLEADGTIQLPIAALVTPSASGFCVMQGVLALEIKRLTAVIERWIPIASNRILQASHNPAFESKEIKAWPILAIYGDRDVVGKRVSNFLASTSDAIVKEIPGRHPCYLDSPDEFVETVVAYISKTRATSSKS